MDEGERGGFREHLTTLDEALDTAKRLLEERFGEADQQAVVSLAQTLYQYQERERFMSRGDRPEDKRTTPYR